MQFGVPKGSHLGSFIFSLLINNLPNVIESSILLMYADDIQIFQSSENFIDHMNFQDSLNIFVFLDGVVYRKM